MIRSLTFVAVALAATPSFADRAAGTCPADVRGVQVASLPVKEGVAFTFTARDTSQLPGLRAFLREAAAVIEHRTKLAALSPTVMPTSTGEGAIVPVDISVKNIASGAYVVVRPEDHVDRAVIAAKARSFEQLWASHECVATNHYARRAVLQR